MKICFNTFKKYWLKFRNKRMKIKKIIKFRHFCRKKRKKINFSNKWWSIFKLNSKICKRLSSLLSNKICIHLNYKIKTLTHHRLSKASTSIKTTSFQLKPNLKSTEIKKLSFLRINSIKWWNQSLMGWSWPRFRSIMTRAISLFKTSHRIKLLKYLMMKESYKIKLPGNKISNWIFQNYSQIKSKFLKIFSKSNKFFLDHPLLQSIIISWIWKWINNH